MPLSVACSSCGSKLRATDNAAGRIFKCPKCGGLVTPGVATCQPMATPIETVVVKPISPFESPPLAEAVNEVLLEADEELCARRPVPAAEKDAASRNETATVTRVVTGFGNASLVLSITGMVFSLFPCIGWMFAIPLCGLGLLLGVIGSIFAFIRQGRGVGFPLAGSITGFAGLGIALMWFTICSGIFTSADRSAKESAHQMANEKRVEQNALDADRDTAAEKERQETEKEHQEAEKEEERKKKEGAAEAERKAAEESEAERKRAAEPNPTYIKAQTVLRDAQTVLREAEAKAKAHPASHRPLFTPLKGVNLDKDFRARGDFVLVYAESGGRPRYAVVEGTRVDVLDVPGDLCRIVFTSGPHNGEEGYVWRDCLPLKAEATIKEYLRELANFHRSEPSSRRYVDEVSAARRKVEEAETDLRQYRLADEETCRKAAERQSWARGLQQIPATVIDKGVLRHIPYKSFRTGDYEINIYGDPDHPSGLEVGIYKSLIQSQDAKNQCMEFMAAVLNDPADRTMLKSLKLTQDIQIRDGLSFEVTPETAEDAYGGWWISVYDPAALDRSRASPQELVPDPR
jgi:predicted RNA-binding Zn-ribbon protein involved in translation (DUF1610 family)